MSGKAVHAGCSPRIAAGEPEDAPASGPVSPPFTLLGPADTFPIGGAWADLAANAVEANPFFAPYMLAPALSHLGGGKTKLLCLWEGEGLSRRLIGLLPLAPSRGYARLPVAYLETWIYRHCFFGAPLVRRGREEAFWKALFSFADAQGRAFLRLPLLDEDGPLIAALKASVSPHRFVYASDIHERAMLHGGYRAEEFAAAHIRKKRLKEMARRRNRLSERAPLSFRMLGDWDDLEEWARTFLALEHGGWKGKADTSFMADPNDTRFLLEMLKGARAAGALQFLRLDSGDHAIAMMINLGRGDAVYGFKICHDEAYARFSPGVMIGMDLLKAMEGMAQDAFLDSCAAPDHPMINSLWPGRRRIAGYNIACAGAFGGAVLRACRTLEQLAKKARSL